MSFVHQVKKDLSALPLEADGCVRAELAGLLSPNSTVIVDDDFEPVKIIFKTDHPGVASRIFRLYKALVGEKPTVETNAKNKRNIEVTFDKDIKTLLKELRLLKNFSRLKTSVEGEDPILEIPVYYLAKQRYLTAFLRGIFLACGNIADPEKGYRLEMSCQSVAFLENVQDALSHYEIKTYFTRRKNMPVLLSKEAESVTNFLGLIGANKALFHIEDVRAVKEIRNFANRQKNADIANLNKTHDAASKQIEAIRKIEKTIGLENLSPGLRMLAEIRLKNPDVSLIELGEMMTPKMGKSGVYRRLNKLIKIADELK